MMNSPMVSVSEVDPSFSEVMLSLQMMFGFAHHNNFPVSHMNPSLVMNMCSNLVNMRYLLHMYPFLNSKSLPFPVDVEPMLVMSPQFNVVHSSMMPHFSKFDVMHPSLMVDICHSSEMLPSLEVENNLDVVISHSFQVNMIDVEVSSPELVVTDSKFVMLMPVMPMDFLQVSPSLDYSDENSDVSLLFMPSDDPNLVEVKESMHSMLVFDGECFIFLGPMSLQDSHFSVELHSRPAD